MYQIQTSEGHLGGYVIGRAAPGTWSPEIWCWCVKALGIKSVLDVGCGLGFAVEYFLAHGIESMGVDGSPSAIRNSRSPDNVVLHDFSLGPWTPNRRFDMVWSAEFVEHVEQRFESNFLETFRCADKFVFMTFAGPGQGGHHHVNEQSADYWIHRLKGIGFDLNVEISLLARKMLPNSGLVGMHFRNRGLVFERQFNTKV